MGAQRSLLFYGEYSGDRVQIPVTCWLVKTTDGTILFDTGLSPRAVPGLMRNDPLARFTEEDLLVHRLDTLGLQAADVDLVVISHLHYDHAGGRRVLREVGAGRAAGRVFLRAPPGGVLRAVLLPEELRPARCALAPARWRYRAGARGDGAAH